MVTILLLVMLPGVAWLNRTYRKYPPPQRINWPAFIGMIVAILWLIAVGDGLP